MSNQAFYFINHTRKEFAVFTKHRSIMMSLKEAFDHYIYWQEDDDIRVDAESYDSASCLEELDALRYNYAKVA